MYVWGAQFEQITGKDGISIHLTTASSVATSADSLSLTSTFDFNTGFLLLDSQTTTDSFIYEIYNSVLKELGENDNGTLKWDIDSTSAQSEGTYPQVDLPRSCKDY